MEDRPRPKLPRRASRLALLLLLGLSVAGSGVADRGAQGPAGRHAYAAPAADGLVTNEFAYWHPGRPGARRSAAWEMTSGSLFARGGRFWTGRPDSCRGGSPDARSRRCTNSNVFRLDTKRSFAGTVAVSLRLRHLHDIHDRDCDAEDRCWHGTHLWLRYKSQYDLYYVSLARADGRVVIKRKIPCGPDNQGSYVLLGDYVRHDFEAGRWAAWRATIGTNRDGSVTISLYDQAASRTVPVVSATDRGGSNPNWSPACATPGRYPSAAYPPIREPGAVGLRGDFAEFEFTGFEVAETGARADRPGPGAAPPARAPRRGRSPAYNGWRKWW